MKLWAILATLAMGAAWSWNASAQERVLDTEQGRIRVEDFAQGLSHPWSLAFLPDGRALVTERLGRLRLVGADGVLSEPLAGVPEVFARGQGGLLDVALSPDFAESRMVYLSFAEPGEGGAGTAVARGRLGEGRLEEMQVVFRMRPKVDGPNHFGSRLAFAPDGRLFVTLGERFKFEPAQDVSNHLGTIVRIEPDGGVPPDNPFVGRAGALPEIWSYGHRNVQGAAIHPETGALWTHEFGPRGGDELNIPQPGRNYGWPLVSWGRHYGGTSIPDPPTRPDLAPSIHHWTPAISPSGMAFYTATAIPGWRGNLLIGGLGSEALVRLTLDGERVTGEERMPMDARIRDVRQGPDGAVYLLTDADDGKILRLTAAR
ncbi:MAG: PQQ-dependent sugar dehydrogenase [Rhodospirillales bacterium]|nr:PQQ-dependent sugar dehydrogenase [Rhodospirillales bacterium]